ncbi:hypothetical protein [Clavibacter tessellarius]|uniref:hypothetical protein n=1 Tax=Clavibacter tessellarius TaxID=31965 RepID=UPI0039E9AE95
MLLHLTAGAFIAGVFWVGSSIASFPTNPGSDGSPRFDWVANGGKSLGETTVTAILAYTAVALVLYGISLGGQSSFDNADHRARVRRSVGVVGLLVAMAAMVLAVFAIGAAWADATAFPSLVVVLPMTVICWALGIEVGRFNVADRDTQLLRARSDLARIQVQLRGLLGRSRRRAFVYLAMAAHVTPLAIASAVAFDATPLVRMLNFAFSFLASFLNLSFLAHASAASLVASPRIRRVGARAGFYGIYAVLAALFSLCLFVAQPEAPNVWALAFTSGLALLLPALFHKFPFLRSGMRDLSLPSALARICFNDLMQAERRAAERIKEIEAQEREEQGTMRTLQISSRLQKVHARMTGRA